MSEHSDRVTVDDLDVEWPEPTPIGARVELPPFPVEVFPQWLADQVAAVAEFTQTDPAMPGASALTVLSACAGGRVEVEVKPGWREPTNIFVATVAAPGERKTPVQNAMTAPLRAVEKQLANDISQKITEAETLRAIAVSRAEQARKDAAKSKSDDKTAEAVSAAAAAEAITVPTLPRLLCDDVTPERLSALLAENSGRIALISDEGGIFETLAGRYDKMPNLDPFLKGHVGATLRVDRIGRDPVFVDRPALTVGLMVQPLTLRDVGRNERFRGRGLLGRFFFVIPTSRVGFRNVDSDPVPDEVEWRYSQQVTTLARTLAEWTDPAVLTLTPEARAIHVKAMQTIEDQLVPGGPLAHIADWATKLGGAVARLAGLLHLARHPNDGWKFPVAGDTMTGAVTLAAALTAHYRGATEQIGMDETTEAARYVLDVILRMGRPEFSTKEVFDRVTRSRFPKVTDLQQPFDLLIDHDWIRPKPQPERTGPGRPPSPRYLVNPYAESA